MRQRKASTRSQRANPPPTPSRLHPPLVSSSSNRDEKNTPITQVQFTTNGDGYGTITMTLDRQTESGWKWTEVRLTPTQSFRLNAEDVYFELGKAIAKLKDALP